MSDKWDRMVEAALDAKGREWRNGILAIEAARRVAPVAGIAALLGGLAFLLHWVWVRATSVLAGMSAPHAVGAMPGWLWLALGAIAVTGMWLFRPGRLVLNPGMRMVQASALLILFAGILGLGLSTITI